MRLPRTLLAASLLLGGCRDPFPRQPGPALRFYEQGTQQTFYDPSGRLLRRLTDVDADGVAERVELFHPDRRVWRLEADLDGDGRIDHWEVYRPDGELEKVGRSRAADGRPDLWLVPDGRGGLSRREVDEDGDGRFDRWQSWESFRLTAERFDVDGDGAPDRQLRFDRSGSVVAVEPYP
jgi:hypothetical protein